MPGLHSRTHPTPVEDCWACRVMTIRVDRGGAQVIDAKDRQLRADLDAYKRLRHDGLQPQRIDGSSEVEKRVDSQFELDLGRYVPKEERSRVEEGFALAKEFAVSPITP